MNIQAGDVSHLIQIAIAPVFLLTTVCTMLLVLTNRLSRIIDRSRAIEERLDAARNEHYLDEADVLYQRYHRINMAITLATACGLLVCLIIALLFIGDTTQATLEQYIAGMFVAAMCCLVGAFGFLLNEILIASFFMRKQCLIRRAAAESVRGRQA